MSVVYQSDDLIVVQGDCSRWATRLGPYGHVITDVPYDEQTQAGARSNSGRELAPWTLSVPRLRSLWSRLAPVTSGWLVSTMSMAQAFALHDKPPSGLRAVRVGAWTKPNAMPQKSGDRPAQGWEAVSIQHVARGRMRWNGGGRPAVWDVPIVQGENPNEKPLVLVASFVQLFTRPGDIILDPFAGSGVLAEAALTTGRRAVVIEREPDQVEQILCRIGRTANRLRQGELAL